MVSGNRRSRRRNVGMNAAKPAAGSSSMARPRAMRQGMIDARKSGANRGVRSPAAGSRSSVTNSKTTTSRSRRTGNQTLDTEMTRGTFLRGAGIAAAGVAAGAVGFGGVSHAAPTDPWPAGNANPDPTNIVSDNNGGWIVSSRRRWQGPRTWWD